MSGYKRFISYIFSYENGIKKDNVGYARIENYNEECRINIYMKDTIKREQKASVYLFYRDKEKIQGIFMKEMTIKNGLGDCRLVTESENVGGSACSFEAIGGIIIYITANRFWGTEWDDKPIYGFEPKKLQEELTEKLSEGLPEELQEEPLGEPSGKADEPAEEQVEEWADELAEKPELKAAVLENDEEMREEEKRYFEGYTKIYPFYEQNRECIGISPEDLAEISPILEQWQSNDFLLHGYGRFRHIILLRKKGENNEYYIGVPGMYRPSEERLAVTYGFNLFVPMKKKQAAYGDFGYWCTPVNL